MPENFNRRMSSAEKSLRRQQNNCCSLSNRLNRPQNLFRSSIINCHTLPDGRQICESCSFIDGREVCVII
ncbi:MAG: hypothetical protein Edafosvirus1_60 [Edafosvirus sp.]|uniref:Uncharacterized protein n=1 Tax=Edafosvirus sp. TaxID=2487765 RepID=A0A3G4ZWB9_9VIRU|nr:MAG: hypothetical protein Edafosvirus1_60 [Edafosvirus sp.]